MKNSTVLLWVAWLGVLMGIVVFGHSLTEAGLLQAVLSVVGWLIFACWVIWSVAYLLVKSDEDVSE